MVYSSLLYLVVALMLRGRKASIPVWSLMTFSSFVVVRGFRVLFLS
ncbi:MAG: hypothetical protein QN229_05225 [Desulfurococcaceae archaeon TW002]